MILKVTPKIFATAALSIAATAGTISCNRSGNSVDNIQNKDTFETTTTQNPTISNEEYSKIYIMQAKGIEDMATELHSH